ncbi:MAG: hypothetical protein AB8F34_05430 [Akkermansiaceae bacterium]
MIDFSKLKVPKDVICDDEGDHLEPQVANYHDNDPDDPSPLFGDSSPDAVAMERMLQAGMSNGMVNAGTLYAHHQALMCRRYLEVKEAKGAASKGAAEENRKTTADLWKPYKSQFLSLYIDDGYGLDDARRKVARTMASDGVWPKNNPTVGNKPSMKILREQLPDPDK